MKQLVSRPCTYKGPPVGSNAEILWQITSAIEYLHDKKICHCNLKPANIFISVLDGTLQPRVKVGNFGFTRQFSKTVLPLWKLVGTKGWMAPEMYECETYIPSMDLFSLGLLFAILLTGVHAFGIEKEDRIFNIKKKKPMILTLQQLQGVAGATDIYNLIRSMLCFVPEERPTATAVLNSSFFSHPSHSTIGSETIAPTDFKPVGKFPSIYFLYILNFPN